MPYRTRCRSCAELVTRNEELRRKDHIIAALTERIPALEPASEPRESSVAASERKDESRGDSPRSLRARRRRALPVVEEVVGVARGRGIEAQKDGGKGYYALALLLADV